MAELRREHVLNPDKTLFDEISDSYPALTNTEIRNTLAAFLFTGDDVFKYIKDLSGGERGRVSLAKLMLSEANFLILDEPTNHLDIVSKEILEQALNAYEGTVLYVSHDRYFINKTAHRILELTQKNFDLYLGNYDYYLMKKAEKEAVAVSQTCVASTAAPVVDSTSKSDWKARKELQAKLRKLENELKKVEEEIERLESRNAEIDEEMVQPEIATNVAKLQELSKEKDNNDTSLATLYERWEAVSEELNQEN